MKNNFTSATGSPGYNTAAGYKTPVLFEIPLYDYADEINRKRDKAWYNKMKRIEAKSKELRLAIEYYAEKKYLMLQKTRELLDLTAAMQNNLATRKSSLNKNPE